MTQRDALNTKNYIEAHKKINFQDRNLLVRKISEKVML